MADNSIAIEDFYLAADGDDYYPAMMRAQSVANLLPNQISPNTSGGWTVLFQPKVYRFSRPIELFRCMYLQGAGGSDNPATRFEFYNQTPGLIIHHGGSQGLSYKRAQFWDESQWPVVADRLMPERLLPAPNDPPIPSAEGSIIEGIDFYGGVTEFPAALPYRVGESFLGTALSYALFFDKDPERVSQAQAAQYGTLVNPFETDSQPDLRAHGIVAYGRFTLRHCMVQGFAGHGIYIYGDTAYANASGWRIDTVRSQFNGNNGLHIVGSDAAIGLAMNLYANHNRLWGVMDLSQLGNQFIGGQASYNGYGGVIRPRYVRFSTDLVNFDQVPIWIPAGMTLLRWFYAEENNAVLVDSNGINQANYAGKFLAFNRFIAAYNMLEYCALYTTWADINNGMIDINSMTLVQGIDSDYRDLGCNQSSLEGEFIPSFDTGLRLQDRLSLMAYGSSEQKVWIRAMSRDALTQDRTKPSYASPPKALPEIIFYTDPAAGDYIGSVYCIVGTKEDGTKEWGYRPFGKIEL